LTFLGAPIHIEALPALSACRGKLLSGEDRGTPVFAASFIRQRRIVLDAALLSQPALGLPVLVHELFHFAWVRLGNNGRASFADLIEAERLGRARGGLGESSVVARCRIMPGKAAADARVWKDFVCESFCDTAAYLFTGTIVGDEGGLARRWLARRRHWFLQMDTRGWFV
jgi:hypothetical protein